MSTPRTPQEEIKEGVKSYLHGVIQREAQKDTLTGKASRFVTEQPSQPGLKAYLREAFLFEWNLLAFFGLGAAAMIVMPPAIPLVLAAELTYLGALVSVPRFRTAIDRRIWQRNRDRSLAAGQHAAPPVEIKPINEILADLPLHHRTRFENLRDTCQSMRDIARDVRGDTSGRPKTEVERLLTGDLDRLLWTFLRYLIVEEALLRFLDKTDSDTIRDQITQLEERLQRAQGDDRLVRSLTDSLATAQTRLENVEQAKRNIEFVEVELDRIEGKIRAIMELAVNRQDPGFISSQVDSVVQSMRMTEQTITELHLVTGLADEFYEPPPILEVTA